MSSTSPETTASSTPEALPLEPANDNLSSPSDEAIQRAGKAPLKDDKSLPASQNARGGIVHISAGAIMEEELFKAMRHDTLKAIDNGENLLRALAGKTGKANDAMRDSTARFVNKLKEELHQWETKYKKGKAAS